MSHRNQPSSTPEPIGISSGKSYFERYVALGDSSTEGLDDPDDCGGYCGWANRLAEAVASANGGSVLYANLGVRGRHTREILEQQLEPALAMAPDLATVFAGTNDIVSRRCDLEAVGADLERMQRSLVEVGATVVSFTLSDLGPVLPAARRLTPRVEALNESLRVVSHRTGARLVDFAAYPVSSDPRLWSEDRLHANALGHARIAAGLAHELDLPGSDGSWREDLPTPARKSWAGWMQGEVSWTLRYLIPWLWRHARGVSSGDGRTAKRPGLKPLNLRRIGVVSDG